MKVRFLGVMTVLVLAAACGSTAGTTGGASHPGISFGTPISTIAKALNCAHPQPVPKDTNDVDVGFHPLDDQTCTFKGQQLEIITVKDSAQMRAFLALSKGFIESFGGEAYFAVGDGWGASLPGDDATPPGEKVTAQQVVNLIGGKVVHFGAPSAASSEPGRSGREKPTAEQAKSWPVQWCKAMPGMTRDQMRALMGPPTDEFPLDSGTPQMSWDFAEYAFNAFMDSNDRVRQLDVNDIQLTEMERAAIKCDFTRRAQ